VRSGITTRVNKTGAEFWSSLPSDLLRRTAYNADVVRAARDVVVVVVVVLVIVIVIVIVVLIVGTPSFSSSSPTHNPLFSSHLLYHHTGNHNPLFSSHLLYHHTGNHNPLFSSHLLYHHTGNDNPLFSSHLLYHHTGTLYSPLIYSTTTQETIELLLAQASQRRTGKCLNLVVWILGVCPPPEALEKVGP
jgi:hypothetical protein